MKMRSTGLGKTELVAKIDCMKRVGDYLALDMKVIEPTNWHVRVGLTVGDVFKIAVLLIKPSNLAYLVASLFQKRGPESHLEL
ncbi:hypothetical protein ACFLU8_03795 [Chloroflexota bacterium]